ncbi:transcription factor bHLH52-like [Musa acuminata AAA Group]|uniref:transcription factor bHLH52-like n=1 Tax=Musa acuminata AAA Group TaxID=214697 RepID=UPI0031D33274
MALSLDGSWEAAEHLIPDVGLFYESQSEVADALLGFFSDPVEACRLPIDSLFDRPGDAYDDTGPTLLHSLVPHPCFSAPSVVSLPPELYAPSDEFDLYHRPKRPRSCNDLCRPWELMPEANSCNVAMPAPAVTGCQVPELSTEFMAPPLPAVVTPACDGERKAGGGCLSAQSVAARARRKRISEKTQELGRLIPGGNKMNTAEMFQAAYKYVKFLQAQVGILELMASIKGWNAPQQVEQKLRLLLASTVVQEKLSGEGRCLVPEQAIESMSTGRDIESDMLISKDLDRFIESVGRSN